MSPKKLFFVFSGLLIILIALILVGALSIDKVLAHQANKLTSLKTKLTNLNQEQLSLTLAKQDIKKYQNLYTISKAVVPENKDQAQAVRQIVNLAAKNNVTLGSISFPASTLGGSVVPGVVPKAAPAPSPNNSLGSSTSLSQLTPVPTIPGVYDMQITVASSTTTSQLATFPQLIGFLQALENNRLTALISSINIQPNSNNHSLFSFTLVMNIYIKPGGK